MCVNSKLLISACFRIPKLQLWPLAFFWELASASGWRLSRAERERSFEQREATRYNWILPCVVGCCPWCQDVAFRPPISPHSTLAGFFFLSFFKWCLHHNEKMSTRTHRHASRDLLLRDWDFFSFFLCVYLKWMSRNPTIVFKVDSLRVGKIGQWCRMCTIVQILFSGFNLPHVFLLLFFDIGRSPPPFSSLTN